MKNDKDKLASAAGEGSGYAVRSSDAMRGNLPATNPVTIRLAVEVSDKSFEAHLNVPVSAGAEYLAKAAAMWIGSVREAIALCESATHERTTSPESAEQPPFNPKKDSKSNV